MDETTEALLSGSRQSQLSQRTQTGICESCHGQRLPLRVQRPRFLAPRATPLYAPCSACAARMVEDIQAQEENAALRRLGESIAVSGVPEEMRSLGLTQGTRPKRYPGNDEVIAALTDRVYPSLVIWGPRGRGKSHLATCWLMDRMRGGAAGLYCLEPLAIAQMWTYTRSHAGRDLYSEAMRVPFVVWDNLGSQAHLPPASRDLVVGVLMARHEARLTTVITCAADPAGGWVADQYGMDLASRLSSWQSVQIQGGDFRSIKLGVR